jgi:hypothetical protein
LDVLVDECRTATAEGNEIGLQMNVISTFLLPAPAPAVAEVE